jgi:hypothetical protein
LLLKTKDYLYEFRKFPGNYIPNERTLSKLYGNNKIFSERIKIKNTYFYDTKNMCATLVLTNMLNNNHIFAKYNYLKIIVEAQSINPELFNSRYSINVKDFEELISELNINNCESIDSSYLYDLANLYKRIHRHFWKLIKFSDSH